MNARQLYIYENTQKRNKVKDCSMSYQTQMPFIFMILILDIWHYFKISILQQKAVLEIKNPGMLG